MTINETEITESEFNRFLNENNVDYKFYEDKSLIQHMNNIKKWGYQNQDILLLAIMEELGELTQAHLENVWEDGKPQNEYIELYDLQALLYAYYAVLEWDRYGKYQYGTFKEFLGMGWDL